MKLDVYVNNQLAGVLEQTDLTRFVFTYVPTAQDCVSLLMPVRTESWVHEGGLHPVFQVSLPEGALRAVLERQFAKYFDRFGDMALLSSVGAHLIGRLRIAPHGQPLNTDSPADGLDTLLNIDGKGLLDRFLEMRAAYSGVSGGFPKALAKSPTGMSAGAATDGHATMIFDRWIVKAGSPDTPALAANEYWGMRLAQNVGLDVPEFRLSANGDRLLVRRFDVDDAGQALGFEDMCALAGLPASAKFSGSVERIVKTLNEMCPPQEAARAREAFCLQYLTCLAMRNGDAHMKNFGLLYDDARSARLSPAYDMVSMSAYAPRREDGDVEDMPALTFGGVRRWPTEKTVKALATRCLVGTSRLKTLRAQLVDGFVLTARALHTACADGQLDAALARRLLEMWSSGLRIHDHEAAQQLMDMAHGVEIEPEMASVYVKPARQRY